ncbi:MAG TPA: F0F1 ATP synthase subunit A [Patescibacteria group bacterium]|nr:F0F1 ATP synthase subunit A [Patescibacteria group bacterium]
MSALHISISAETIAHVGPLAVSNSIFTSLVVSVLLVILALTVHAKLKAKGKPSRFQAMMEMIIESLYNLTLDITGSRQKTALFFPLIATFFLFILFNNWFGLLPGVGAIGFREIKEGVSEFVPYMRAGTADLNTTIALALVSVVVTQYFGLSALGLSYLKKYFNFSNPMNAFVGILEFILELAKVMSFGFRLFGNVFAGEVLLAVMTFLVPVIIPMPFYGLELFVGVIQALVFAMLSLVFFNLATVGHGGEEH